MFKEGCPWHFNVRVKDGKSMVGEQTEEAKGAGGTSRNRIGSIR